jgi:hypothetical protein
VTKIETEHDRKWADLKDKMLVGRGDRVAGRRKHFDDYDAGRGVKLGGPASITFLNGRLASGLENAVTDMVLLMASQKWQTLDVIATSIANVIGPLTERISTLESQLEQRSYKGVWQREASYREHNLVTFGGNIWIALKDTGAQPGQGDDWQLAVKKGRDGRDAR